MADRPTITSYPDAWSAHASRLLGAATLDVAGYSVVVEITRAQIERVHFPLLATLADLAAERCRVIAGLAGIPGSGKSTFAAVLAHLARHVLPPETFVVVGMDGWHWPDAVLDRRTTCDAAGHTIPLRQRKGSPESFDVAALGNALLALRTGDRAVSLPVYDRRRHEPAADALTIPPETRIILVEGNYLLSTEAPWARVSGQLRPKLFLECDAATARDRIIARHVRGGATPEEAAAKYEANDRLNSEIVLATAGNADWRVWLEPEPALLASEGRAG